MKIFYLASFIKSPAIIKSMSIRRGSLKTSIAPLHSSRNFVKLFNSTERCPFKSILVY